MRNSDENGPHFTKTQIDSRETNCIITDGTQVLM